MRDRDGPQPIPFRCRHGWHKWNDPIAARWGENHCNRCGVSDPRLTTRAERIRFLRWKINMHEHNGEYDHAAWARIDLYNLRNCSTAT